MENIKKSLPVKDSKGRIVHPADSECLVDPRNIRQSSETHLYKVLIDKSVLEAVPGVLAVTGDEVRVTCVFKPLDDCIVCSMKVVSEISILDEHDLKSKKLTVSDADDLTLSPDPDTGDILPDARGRYDLKPSVLALFFSSVPSQFSTTHQKAIEGNGYEILSEDEFKKREARGDYADNPFSVLKDGDDEKDD